MNYSMGSSYYRSLVSGIDSKIPLNNGKYVTAINFDNAATTPPFKCVIQDLLNFIPWYSSIHRGTGYKSQLSSKIYEDSREVVANFIGCDLSHDVVIYVKNTTEAINKLSYRLYDDKKDEIILCSRMEHHSNYLPWKSKYTVECIDVDEYGRLRLDDLEYKLRKYRGKIKLLAITGASNVTGYINPIYHIAKLAHEAGTKILVDGAQLVPHAPLDMKPYNSPEHIDYLVFSAHKMYAPFGIGVLIGPRETFATGIPDYSGGGTVKLVSDDLIIWDNPPEKDEAGTPNVLGVKSLITAIEMLNKIDMNTLYNYEKQLCDYTFEKLKIIPDIELYCDLNNNCHKVGIIPFNISGIPHNVTAKILSGEAGIAVRNGCFCAQPYIQRLLKISQNEINQYAYDPNVLRPGMVRVSLGLYNTYNEVDILIYILNKIVRDKKSYLNIYSHL